LAVKQHQFSKVKRKRAVGRPTTPGPRRATDNRANSKRIAAKRLNSGRLSPHFTLSQFLRSETAKRKGLSNNPSKNIIKNLQLLAAGLEKVRVLLKRPIVITSGFRSKFLNAAVGGSKTSQHMQGLAVDFVCKEYGTPYRICKKIAESEIEFDQLIHEHGKSRTDQWVHLSFGPRNRREVLTIWSVEGGRKNGLHRYPRKRKSF
jgi:uncharacterized protein YcbK (DUF882 family)